jgi:hypothetical protein
MVAAVRLSTEVWAELVRRAIIDRDDYFKSDIGLRVFVDLG